GGTSMTPPIRVRRPSVLRCSSRRFSDTLVSAERSDRPAASAAHPPGSNRLSSRDTFLHRRRRRRHPSSTVPRATRSHRSSCDNAWPSLHPSLLRPVEIAQIGRLLAFL